MADFNSQQGHIGFRGQVNQGGFLTPTKFTKVLTGNLGADSELIIPDPEIGGGRDITEAYPGSIKFSGDIEFYFRPESLGVLLYALCGTVATTNTGLGSYKHTFTTIQSGNLPYISAEEKVASTLDTFNFVDGKVNSLNLECEAGDLLRGTFNMIFTTQSGNIAASTPTFDTSPMLVSHGGNITLDGTVISTKSVAIEFNNNLIDDDFRIGNRFLGSLLEKRRELNVSLRIRPQDASLYRKAVYGSASSPYTPGNSIYSGNFIADFQSPTLIGSSALPFRLQITMAKCYFKPFPIVPAGDDAVEFELELLPAYNNSSPIIQFELWNSSSSVLV